MVDSFKMIRFFASLRMTNNANSPIATQSPREKGLRVWDPIAKETLPEGEGFPIPEGPLIYYQFFVNRWNCQFNPR